MSVLFFNAGLDARLTFVLHLLNLNTDFLGEVFQFLHTFTYTSTSSFVPFVVELYKIILEGHNQVFQL